MAELFVLYGRPDCEDTRRVREHLRYRGVKFQEININEDPEGEQFVLLINSGSRVTPTLVMGPDDDKIILSKPSNAELDRVLGNLGYRDPRPDEMENGIPNRDPNP